MRSALTPEPAGAAGPAGPVQRAIDPFGGRGVVGFHPGLLSGVALAGANRPPEPGQDDGILTATEVAELDLSGVELVALSACETGLGESAGGEGVLGLQRLPGGRCRERGGEPLERGRRGDAGDDGAVLPGPVAGGAGEAGGIARAQLWMLRGGPARGGQGDGGPGQQSRPRAEGPASRRGLEPLPEPGEGRVRPYYWAAFVLSGDWR